MEKFKINLIIFLCLTAFSAILLSSCGDDTVQPSVSNSDSCGAQSSRSRSFNGPLFGGYSPSTYTLGSERYYNFFIPVDSICTDNHVNSFFSATAFDIPGRPIRFDAALEWQIFWEKRDTGSYGIANGIRAWNARIDNVGLRVPFGDDPALVYINVYVHFPTVGTLQQDSAFLAQNLRDCGFVFDYKYHKFPADDNLITPENYNQMRFYSENGEKYLLDKKMKSALNHDFKKENIIR